MMKHNKWALFFLFAFAIAAPAAAEDASSLSVSVSVPQKDSRRIGLDEVTRRALENCLDVQIAKYDVYIKRQDLRKVTSMFDTFLSMEGKYTKDALAPATTLLAARSEEKSYTAAVSKKFGSGTTLTVGANDTRLDSTSTLLNTNPYHQALLSAGLSQPLGKNFFGMADRAAVKISKIDIENAEYTTLDTIEGLLYRVQVAYWNLVLKKEEMGIKKEMLEEAVRLYDIYKEKLDLGTAETGAVLAMDANEKSRRSDYLTAELSFEQAKNDLLFLINEDDLSITLDPVDSLDEAPLLDADVYGALREAVSRRRDYKRLLKMLDASGIDLAVKQNALWPEIDLDVSYARNGISAKFSSALGGISRRNDPELVVAVSVEMPWENNSARSELKKTELAKAQLLLSLKRTERFILKEVVNKVKEIRSLKEQVEINGSICRLQRKKLDEEMKKLRYGRSSSDLIIRYEDDLLSARLVYANSLFARRRSLIDLKLVENSLLPFYWDEELL